MTTHLGSEKQVLECIIDGIEDYRNTFGHSEFACIWVSNCIRTPKYSYSLQDEAIYRFKSMVEDFRSKHNMPNSNAFIDSFVVDGLADGVIKDPLVEDGTNFYTDDIIVDKYIEIIREYMLDSILDQLYSELCKL